MKLERRIYTSQGPKAVWHADGYDKLKPYGLPVHGCTDGFSRKVLWLQVCRSNNDPIILAQFFVTALEKKIVQIFLKQTAVRKMEWWLACTLFFHNESHARRYGASHSNQKIENNWSHYKQTYTTRIMAAWSLKMAAEHTCFSEERLALFLRNDSYNKQSDTCHKAHCYCNWSRIYKYYHGQYRN